LSKDLPVKYLLDTNVYLEAVRSADTQARFRKTFFPLLPATFLSAVVAYELSVNAQDRRTPSLLREFIHPMERTGRVVTPTFDDWLKASAVMSAVGERDRAWRSTRSRRQIASPSRSGRRTSSSMTSYSWLANRATASWPLGVSST